MPLNRPVSAVPLALWRIGFGLLLAAEHAHLLYFRSLLTPPGASPLWSALLRAAALAGLPAALALAAGAFTRVAATVSWLCAVAAFGFATRRLECAYQADGFFVFGALLAMLSPVERALSWDVRVRRIAAAPISSLHGVWVAVMLAATYLDAFSWKIGTAPWRAGLGLWVATSQPFATWFDLSRLSGSPLIVPLGYLTLAFQGSFALLIWLRRLRPLLGVIGVSMHLLIGLLFPIPLFGLVVALFYLPVIWERPLAGAAPASRAARIAIIAWVVVWPLIGVQAFLPRQSPLAQASQRLQRLTCAVVGLCRHPIFLPGPFHDHVPEYRIAFSSADGRREIPLTSVEGTMQSYGFNRNWSLYSLYVHQPTLGETIPGLQRFCRFWAERHHLDGQLLIEQRVPDVDFGAFDPERLAANRRRPWSPAASVACRP